MNQARSRSDGGEEENASRDQNHHENERRWQQERLRREEAYYQFMNDLSDEDYRLMRDHDLLGTPGEITSEELQQRLDGLKEHLASQPDLRNGTNNRDSGVPREGSNEDPLLEWLNTFRRTGNATRSGQNGNQTWRAVSRTNPHSGDFRFSLEIHINHENRGLEMDGEDAPGLPLSALGRDPRADRDGQRRASSPVARRTRSHAAGAGAGGGATPPRTRLGSRGRNPVEGPLAASGRPRTGTGGPSGGAPRAGFAGPPAGGAPRPREGQRFGAAHVWELGARSNVTVRNTNQRLEPIRLRSAGTSRSRSPIHRQSGPVRPTPQSERRPLEQSVGRSVRRRGVTRVFLQQDRDRRGTAYTWLSNSRLMSRITLEEEEPRRSPPAAARRPPTITLDLQVRRLRPGEGRDRDSIAHRTRSRVGLAENAVTLESGGGGFRRTISRLERSGMRTYLSTITVPLRRLAGTQRLEPSSAVLRSILRQIMTGLGELSSLMEAEAEAEAEGPGDARHLPPTPSGARRPGAGRVGSQRRAAASSSRRRARSREGRAARPGPHSSTLVETGMLPILRLAHFFLLNEGDGAERIRGLTKEQIDNLSTRHYEHSGRDSDLARICSVCISDYVTGNKLRQLPCMHEFHIHCIDRWLSENCTCPICRQPVLGSSTADDG